MALLRYFQQHADPLLPKPDDPLDGCIQLKHCGCQQKGETGARSIRRGWRKGPYTQAWNLRTLHFHREGVNWKMGCGVRCDSHHSLLLQRANCHTHKRLFPTIHDSFIHENSQKFSPAKDSCYTVICTH